MKKKTNGILNNSFILKYNIIIIVMVFRNLAISIE